jgi:hypothetical protein
MNRHAFLDLATVAAGSLALRGGGFFSRSLDGPDVAETTVDASAALDGIGVDGRRRVTVDTLAGRLRGAYLASRWHGDDHPTLLYHHGSGENPFDPGRFSSNSARRLFATDAWDVPANLLLVRAPFHDRSSRAYVRSMGDLASFVGMCAASTALIDALVGALRARGCPLVVVSGISLGGWVTNLHRAFHDTADRYVPIFAGAALGELFATSAYRLLTGREARARPDRLRERLDFERAFDAAEGDCRPLLARHDRIVEFDVQRACYERHPLTVIETGHVTGSLATGPLRAHLRAALDDGVVRGGA